MNEYMKIIMAPRLYQSIGVVEQLIKLNLANDDKERECLEVAKEILHKIYKRNFK